MPEIFGLEIIFHSSIIKASIWAKGINISKGKWLGKKGWTASRSTSVFTEKSANKCGILLFVYIYFLVRLVESGKGVIVIIGHGLLILPKGMPNFWGKIWYADAWLLVPMRLPNVTRWWCHCSSLAGEKGVLYVFKWRFGNFQKVWKFLKFGHYAKEFKL